MNNNKIKIVGRFIFKKLTSEEAKDIFNSGVFELYHLREDNTESLITTEIELNEAIEKDEIGIEVGQLDENTDRKELLIERLKACFKAMEESTDIMQRMGLEEGNFYSVLTGELAETEELLISIEKGSTHLDEAKKKITFEMLEALQYGDEIMLNDKYTLYHYCEEDIIVIVQSEPWEEILQVLYSKDEIIFEQL